jgi:CxxC-x17-CxxC domain-containing protein
MSEERAMYPCTCAECGKDSQVPFQPKEGRQYIAKNVYQNIVVKDFELILFKII